jgi:DNA repair protein RadC
MKIRDIPPENRPRERLHRLGPDHLSDSELLAIILQQGTVGENAIDLSNRLIAQHSLDGLSTLSPKELQKIKGIGPAKASQITSIFALAKRCSLKAKEKTPVKTAQDVYEYAKEILGGKDREHILILYLDSKNRINKHETISMGTLNSSLIHPREVFKTAIKENTSAIIITHNHPSGDPSPSKDDREITKELRNAGELLEIQVIDHVIIGKDTYYSFKERNQLG